VRSGDYLAYTWRNVGRARLRLLLTVSAVVIGATLIVVMTSIGGGIQRNVLEDIRAAGGLNEILVSAGLRPQPGGPGLRPTAALNGETVQAISRLDGVVAVLPEMLLSGVEITYDGLVAQPLIIGVPEEYAAAYGFPPALGRPVPARGQVVLGARVPEVFFDANRQRAPAPALIGQTVQLVARRAGVPAPGLPGFGAPVPAPPAQYTKDLEVVGLLRVQGTQDDFTAWLTVEDVLDVFEWFTGRRPDPQVESYYALRVKTASTEQVRAVQQAISAMDLQATSPLSVLEDVNRGMLILQALLGAIGLVALIVSGLGVANTMLMATLERTREIGILKALGATDRQVVGLFLLEASLIGLVGALVGLLVGWLATQVINLVVLQLLASSVGALPGPPRTVLYTPAWVPPAVIVLAWLVAVLAGLYPALRAARLNIAQALRAE